MTKRANIIFATSFLVGLAGLQVYAWRLKVETQGGPFRRVMITTQDLSAGERLNEGNLGTMDVPENYIDSRRIVSAERENLLGVSVQTALKAGDSLVWSDLADGVAHRHLASVVAPGKRAFRLNSSSNSLGRLLRAGDHVDVLLEEKGKSRLLLERVLVLALGDVMATSDSLLTERRGSGEGVTLSVSARQAEQLLAGESRGELRLVLRNPLDLKKKLALSPPGGKKPREEQSRRSEKGREIEHVR